MRRPGARLDRRRIVDHDLPGRLGGRRVAQEAHGIADHDAVGVVRRLLVILNALARSGQSWNPNHA